MNVSLTPKLEAFVRLKVASGLYNNASEVMREALRLLLEREAGGARTEPAAPTLAPPTLADVRNTLAGLEQTLRARGVTSAAVFGSVARGEAGPASDVDLLIDVDPAARFSLLDLAALGELLQERLGRQVDLVTREGLDPRLRERVLREAETAF